MSIGSQAELALGTAQFGLAYGVAGRKEAVGDREVGVILERAASRGIRRLDTAAAYGTIEARLAHLAGGLPFDVVSKVPALPDGCDTPAARRFVEESLDRSLERLGELLRGMLFHSAEDLRGPHGAVIWEVAASWGQRHGIAVGASCYDPATLAGLRRSFRLEMAQLPGNAWDQRLLEFEAGLQGIEITLRSLFLQGLLLMPAGAAARRLPVAGTAIARWSDWCRDRGVQPLRAALGAAKGLPNVRYCLVGVDDVAQLDEIVAAWEDAPPCLDQAVAITDPRVIDPRQWELCA